MEELYGMQQVDSMQLKYFLTKEEPRGYEHSLFGVKVVKLAGGFTEEEQTGAVSEDEIFIKSLLAKLYRNMVTPWALNETVDELLSGY